MKTNFLEKIFEIVTISFFPFFWSPICLWVWCIDLIIAAIITALSNFDKNFLLVFAGVTIGEFLFALFIFSFVIFSKPDN